MTSRLQHTGWLAAPFLVALVARSGLRGAIQCRRYMISACPRLLTACKARAPQSGILEA